MRHAVKTIVCIVCGFLIFGCQLLSAQNLLTNGSFEDPDVPSTGYTDSPITDWTISETESFQVSIFDRADFPAVDGTQFVAFNASSTPAGGSIHQTFTTIPNATYEVAFWATANVPSSSSFDASIFDGSGIGGIPFANQNGTVGSSFTETILSFQAQSATSTIAFIDTSPQTAGSDLFLDNATVTFVSIPEPTSIAVVSLLGLASTLRRRRAA